MSDIFKSSSQLKQYAADKKGKSDQLTTGFGTPVGSRTESLTIGPHGPIPFQDIVLYEELSRFDRERVPERVVHAKGAGAFGYFEVTHDISKYTKASVFAQVGKRTPIAVRFSFVTGEKGSADTSRDPRGFAVKFYTDEGIWDLVANNTPLFFIRDPILFPMIIHSNKRNPVTNLKDRDMFWDFFTLRPESIHVLTQNYFGDRGIPDGYRHMNGYSANTFKLVNKDGDFFWCKFHLISDQGIRNLTPDQADLLAGTSPDYATQDLYEAIANGKYPSWTMYIQVMTNEQVQKVKFNPFDITKIWPKGEFPRIPVGKLVLNRNQRNYFAEIEQIAFSPAHMPPGIEASPDKMLQARLFSYTDTQYHRLGPNHLQLPVNTCPFVKIRTYQIDGLACVTDNNDGTPTYFPNSFYGPQPDKRFLEHQHQVTGLLARFDTQDEDNYSQCKTFYTKILDEDEKNRLCNNIAEHLSGAKEFLQKRAIEVLFKKVDEDYAKRIMKFLDIYKSRTNPFKTI